MFQLQDEPKPGPFQIFAVVRHAERADVFGATLHGKLWADSEEFSKFPLDPPLSDSGRSCACDLANEIALRAAAKHSRINVVVTSPYMRCIETACTVAKRLGNAMLMVDASLGEVFGPDIFGDAEPQPVRPAAEIMDYIKSCQVEVAQSTVGSWPEWPESYAQSRSRYVEALLKYLARGTRTSQNFVVVSHAECLSSCCSIMPSLGEANDVGYGAVMLASRNWPETPELGRHEAWRAEVWSVHLGHPSSRPGEAALSKASKALHKRQSSCLEKSLSKQLQALLGAAASSASKEESAFSDTEDFPLEMPTSSIERNMSQAEMSYDTTLFAFGRIPSDHQERLKDSSYGGNSGRTCKPASQAQPSLKFHHVASSKILRRRLVVSSELA